MIKIVKWNEHTKNKWNKQAVSWDKRNCRIGRNGSRKDIIPLFNTYVERDTSVLDIGCGRGYGTYKLKESAYEVTGIDISEKMVQLAKTHLGNDVPLYVGSVDDLPFN